MKQGEKWMWEAIDAVERFEDGYTGLDDTDADDWLALEWQRNSWSAFLGALFPKAKLRQKMKLTPSWLGGLFGGTVDLKEKLAFSPGILASYQAVDLAFQDLADKLEVIRSKYGFLPATWSQLLELVRSFRCVELQAQARKEWPAFMLLQNRILSLANSQPSEVRKEFFAGYQLALSAGTINDDMRPIASSSATMLDGTIAFCSPIIRDRVSNVTELHAFLIPILGRNLTGDLERIQQHAKRRKIRLAVRGRKKRRVYPTSRSRK